MPWISDCHVKPMEVRTWVLQNPFFERQCLSIDLLFSWNSRPGLVWRTLEFWEKTYYSLALWFCYTRSAIALWFHTLNYRISGLPTWCYTPKIGHRLVVVLKDSNTLEIYYSNSVDVGQFFKIWALLYVYKPLRKWILVSISGLGKFKANIQYEQLSTICFFYGQIGHIFNRCAIL